jgi:hypothetical protein
MGRAERDVVAVQSADRDHGQIRYAEPPDDLVDLIDDVLEPSTVPAHQIHLVDAHHDVLDPKQRGDVRVPPGLGDDPAAGVDQHQRDVCGRRAGKHVAGVALVARGVGKDERSPRGREEPVGDVDRDALLALGTQAVGDRREIQRSPARDVLEVIGQQRSRVQQQASDQGALAVVDRPRGRQPQQFALAAELDGCHQK